MAAGPSPAKAPRTDARGDTPTLPRPEGHVPQSADPRPQPQTPDTAASYSQHDFYDRFVRERGLRKLRKWFLSSVGAGQHDLDADGVALNVRVCTG